MIIKKYSENIVEKLFQSTNCASVVAQLVDWNAFFKFCSFNCIKNHLFKKHSTEKFGAPKCNR